MREDGEYKWGVIRGGRFRTKIRVEVVVGWQCKTRVRIRVAGATQAEVDEARLWPFRGHFF